MEARTVLFFGSSGSGKGTQAGLLKTYLERTDKESSILHIETGIQFREFMKGGTHTQRRVRETLGEGGLLPAFLPIWVWGNTFIREFEGNEHLILDGLARREAEAPVLDGALKFYGRYNPDVVILNVSRTSALGRLKKRGRDDDTDEDIHQRIDWYEENVIPAIDFFRGKPEYNIHEMDGEKETDVVHEKILDALKL